MAARLSDLGAMFHADVTEWVYETVGLTVVDAGESPKGGGQLALVFGSSHTHITSTTIVFLSFIGRALGKSRLLVRPFVLAMFGRDGRGLLWWQTLELCVFCVRLCEVARVYTCELVSMVR